MKYLVILLLIFSCAKQEKGETNALGSGPELRINIAGLSNIGEVSRGEEKFSYFEIENSFNTPKDLNVVVSNPLFLIDKIIGQNCNLTYIEKNTTCRYRIKFSSMSLGIYEAIVSVNGRSLKYSAKVIETNQGEFSPSSWPVGTLEAGEVQIRTFELTNTGDNPIALPSSFSDSSLSLFNTNCPEFILSKGKCEVSLRYQQKVSGSYDSTIYFEGDSNTSIPLRVTSSILPREPSGIILFDSLPSKLRSNGSEIHTITARLFDEYQNVVSDGNLVNVSAGNLSLPGGNTYSSVDGKIVFDIQTTTNSIPGTLSLQSAQASGFASIESSTGAPFGVIEMENYNPRIRADGTSELTMRTKILRDINGNIVDNGFPVYASMSNSGIVVNNPVFTFNGRAFITIRSSTTAEFSDVQVRANPILDSSQNITGYNASGDFQVEFTSLPPTGNFQITSNLPAIYYKTDINVAYPQETLVEIGPLRDENNNLRGLGYVVPIQIYNGVSADKSQGANSFNIQTDTDSIARFSVKGIEVSGPITIVATVDSSEVSHQVWASREDEIRYSPSSNRLTLYTKSISSNFNTQIPQDILTWDIFSGALGNIVSKDTLFIGNKKLSSSLTSVKSQMRNANENCLTPVLEHLFMAPCSARISDVQTSIGNTVVQTFNSLGVNKFYELNNYGKNLIESGGHLDGVLTQFNKFYSQKFDSYFVYGGLDTTNSNVNSVGKLTQYKGVSSVKTAFDPISNFSYNPSVLPSPSLSAINSETSDTYLFGGLEITGENPLEIGLSNNLHKLIYDDNNNVYTFEEVQVDEDDLLNEAAPEVMGANLIYHEGLLYMLGGYIKDPIITNTFLTNNEIWSIDLSQENFKWKRECQNCFDFPLKDINLSFDSTHFNTLDSVLLEDRSNFEYITRNGKNYLIDTKNSSYYEINFNSLSISELLSPNFFELFNGNRTFKMNPITKRIYSLKTNSFTTNSSEFLIFDQFQGYKSAYISKFFLSQGAKNGLMNLNIDFVGHASATTVDASEITQYSLAIYGFNHDENEWEIIYTNDYVSDFEAYSNPDTISLGTGANKYVDSQGFLTLLITPLYSPGYQTGTGPLDGSDTLRIGHISVNGVW